MTSPELTELIETADQTAVGPEERAILGRALDLAQEASDEDAEYAIRMRITASDFMRGDLDGTLASFSWCLGRHDADPVRFPQKVGEGYDLLWQFKWVAEILLRHPRFPLAQVDAVVTDMETHYRRAGVGLSGVWQVRLANALATGHPQEAAAFRDEREAVGTDEYSHCHACVRSEDADLEWELGNHERAVALLDEIVEGRMECGDEPEQSMGRGLLRLLRAGRPDDAVALHRHALRLARRNADPFPLILPHLPFLAVTGNEARALDLLERYLPQLPDHPLDAERRLGALTAFGVALDAVAAAGHGDQLVRGAESDAHAAILGTPEGSWTAETLAAACWRAAAELAAAFDARNGTDRRARQVAEARTLASERWEVPMGSEPMISDAVAEQVRPRSGTQWAERAWELSQWGDDAEALDAVDAGLAVSFETLERVRLLQEGVKSTLRLGRHEQAQDYAERIERELRIGGLTDWADAVRTLGPMLYVPGNIDVDAVARLAASVGDAEPAAAVQLLGLLASGHLMAGDAERAVATAQHLARVGRSSHQLDDQVNATMSAVRVYRAVGLVDEAADELRSTLALPVSRGARATLVLESAQLAASRGEFDAALTLADEAIERFGAMGSRLGIVQASLVAAAVLNDLGRPDDAVLRAHVAMRHSRLADLPPMDALLALGTYQRAAGLPLDAAHTFEDLAEVEQQAGVEAQSVARTYLLLASSAREGSDLNRAYAALGAGLALAEQAEDADLAAEARHQRGELLALVGDEEGLADLDAAEAHARSIGVPAFLSLGLASRGRARIMSGVAEGTADVDEAITIARNEGEELHALSVTDDLARALVAVGRLDAGVSLLLEVADGYAAAGQPSWAAQAERWVALALHEAGRDQDAVTIHRQALERDGVHQDVLASLRQSLAQLESEIEPQQR